MTRALLLIIMIISSIELVAQPTINGDMSDASYTTLGTLTSGRTGHSPNDKLGALKYYNTGSDIYIGITGLTTGYGYIVLFFDFSGVAGRGNNTLKGTGTTSLDLWNSMLAGVKLDSGFDPDFAICITTAGGSDCYVNGVRFDSNGYVSSGSIGSWTSDVSGGSHDLTGTAIWGGTGTVTSAYHNGYNSDSNKGFELKIPISAFSGAAGGQTIKLFAFLTGKWEFYSAGQSGIYNVCIPGDPGASSPLANNFDFSSVSGQTFYVDTPTLLPVELTSFTISKIDGKILLNWKTATEVNNYGFNVQRRVKNEEWQKIGFVQGHGNSNSPKNYSFYDASPLSDTVQYRLKQIDFDGKFEYSDIVETNVEAPANFALNQNHPNPFNPETTISYKVQTVSQVSLKVFDVLGREVVTLVDEYKQPGTYNSQFSIMNYKLSSGVYFYTLTAGGFSSTKKMLLMK